MAEFVRDVERHDAQIMCGYQDAVMIVRGGIQSMDFVGKHPTIPGPLPSVAPLDVPLPFLLITTGVERLSGSVHGPMSERWLAGEPSVLAGMTRIAELGRQGAALLQEEDWNGLADAMTENHSFIRGLGGSGDAIDALIDECLAEGALAAKLAGAGMGGTVIALTLDPEGLQERLSRRGRTRFIRPEAAPGLCLEEGAVGPLDPLREL
jgi:galactokinase/mevalonate kinase-like predicted kinase